MSEIRELVEEDIKDLTPESKEALCEDIYGLFYEVEFNIEYDRDTGKITKIVTSPSEDDQKEIFQ